MEDADIEASGVVLGVSKQEDKWASFTYAGNFVEGWLMNAT